MSLKRQSGFGSKLLAGTLALSLCMSAGMSLGLSNVSADAEKEYSIGDVNGDGSINLNDANLELRFALSITKPDEGQAVAADVNYDGSINLTDANKVLRVALGIEKFDLPPAVTTAPPAVPTQTAPAPVIPTRPSTSSTPHTQTPVPTSIPLPKVEPGEAVTGTSISHVNEAALNGAEVDENGIYKFTEDNAKDKIGIEFTNPWAGMTSLNEKVDEVLPHFFIDERGACRGVIKGDKLVSLDGSNVIGTVSVSGDAAEALISTGSAVDATGDAVETVTGTSLLWNISLLPRVGEKLPDEPIGGNKSVRDLRLFYDEKYSECYVKPSWSKGVSISFWSKYTWKDSRRSDAAPILIIRDSSGCDTQAPGTPAGSNHGGDFSMAVFLDGSVRMEGDQTGNGFYTENYIAGNNGEWNYYTVTIANDWITVYVNGQELVYSSVKVDKDLIQYFNNGFLSRYNPVYPLTKEEADKVDVRQYLKKGFVDVNNNKLDVLDIEHSIIGNGRYSNPDAVTKRKTGEGYDLLIDLITDKDTQIWFGAPASTKCSCLSTDKGQYGFARYSLQNGTMLTDVNTYNVELTPEQVAANYEKEYSANVERLGLVEK